MPPIKTVKSDNLSDRHPITDDIIRRHKIIARQWAKTVSSVRTKAEQEEDK